MKTANMYKILNELKSLFFLQYFYSGYLNSRKKFLDPLIFAQSVLNMNLAIILAHVQNYLGKCTKNSHAEKFVPKGATTISRR